VVTEVELDRLTDDDVEVLACHASVMASRWAVIRAVLMLEVGRRADMLADLEAAFG
jgi:hypothetical protein